RESTQRAPPRGPPPAEEPPDEEPVAGGALGYTSYSVAGYTTPRISTDEVRIWETTAAVVTVGGAAVSAASCCGDFTNEAPISPPTASRAAAMPTPSSTRRRRANRDPRTDGGPLPPSGPGPLSVAGEPSCVTRNLRCRDGRVQATPSTAVLQKLNESRVSFMSTPARRSSHETPTQPEHDVHDHLLR